MTYVKYLPTHFPDETALRILGFHQLAVLVQQYTPASDPQCLISTHTLYLALMTLR